MSSVSLGWALANQSVAIPDQLDYGIRGFLIDTHYGRMKPDGSVVTDDDHTVAKSVGPRNTYLCHEFCEIGAERLTPVLRQIRRFLQQHPNNVLLIDNEDYIKPKAFARAAGRSRLRNHIYEGPTDDWPTLRQMISAKQQVVVLADNRGGGISWYHHTYAGIMQETPYSFDPPSELWNAKNWRKSCGPNRGDVTGSLFLMNHWSPSTPPPAPDLETAAHVNARSVIYNRARTCERVRGRIPSIIAADQVDTGGLLAAVRDLNGIGGSVAKP